GIQDLCCTGEKGINLKAVSSLEGTDKHMEFYNNERPHESLNYLTPKAFYEELQRNNASRGQYTLTP
ncbi:MAG: integrase core domain-containing protein, partial [Thermanaeromonas sp.]|uniref:integrase core domain-containing protein n=1 Tax=Thermanaeromonas sp. TaxID=2003697 RepID=UPI00243DB57E